MSGQAALASARKRRVNIPSQQQTGQQSNSYQNELNSIAEEFSKNIDSTPQQRQRVPLANVVMLHDKRINILKKELDELKVTTNDFTNKNSIPNTSKVTFSESETSSVKSSDDINNLTQKLESVELSTADVNSKLDLHDNKIKTIEQEFANMKKDVENFKVIFLNVNKIINDLKALTDANTNELGIMKNFLNEYNFVAKDESQETNKVEIEVTEK